MAGRCSFIKANGDRCRGTATGPHGLCWAHDPANAEQRRRQASKAGRSKPDRELAGIKERLSGLADDVLAVRVDKGVAAVASQVLNVYLRAIATELKVKEVGELEARLEALEGLLEGGPDQRKGRTWG